MTGAASNYRNVRYEDSWEEDLARLRQGQPPPAAIDEIVGGIDWTLGRIGEKYPEVADTPYRVMNIPAAQGLPALNAWFIVEDDERVCCYRLQEAEPVEEEDEPGDPW